MTRACLGALLALVVAGACDGEFRFDEPVTVAGSGGIGPVSNGVAGYDEATESGGGVRDANGCADCADFGLKCATEWEACVECVEDADCSSDQPYCDAQLHRCLPCNTNGGCDSGSICDGWSHACMGACATENDPDSDCDGGARMCDQRRNVCVACHDDDDCHDPLNPHCAPGGARCAECASDRDCTGRLCDPLLFVCVVCRDSRDCPIGAICDATAHTCMGADTAR